VNDVSKRRFTWPPSRPSLTHFCGEIFQRGAPSSMMLFAWSDRLSNSSNNHSGSVKVSLLHLLLGSPGPRPERANCVHFSILVIEIGMSKCGSPCLAAASQASQWSCWHVLSCCCEPNVVCICLSRLLQHCRWSVFGRPKTRIFARRDNAIEVAQPSTAEQFTHLL
jgi:hypothetical protein